MIKKLVKYAKIAIAMALIASLALPSYATVGASDGSAFVTKAEFDAALADFNARLTTFEAGINSKIDSQVSSYLDRNGIWNGSEQTFKFKYINAGYINRVDRNAEGNKDLSGYVLWPNNTEFGTIKAVSAPWLMSSPSTESQYDEGKGAGLVFIDAYNGTTYDAYLNGTKTERRSVYNAGGSVNYISIPVIETITKTGLLILEYDDPDMEYTILPRLHDIYQAVGNKNVFSKYFWTCEQTYFATKTSAGEIKPEYSSYMYDGAGTFMVYPQATYATAGSFSLFFGQASTVPLIDVSYSFTSLVNTTPFFKSRYYYGWPKARHWFKQCFVQKGQAFNFYAKGAVADWAWCAVQKGNSSGGSHRFSNLSGKVY